MHNKHTNVLSLTIASLYLLFQHKKFYIAEMTAKNKCLGNKVHYKAWIYNKYKCFVHNQSTAHFNSKEVHALIHHVSEPM